MLYAVDIVHISKALGKSSLGFTFYTLPVLCWCFKDPFTLHRSDLFMKYPCVLWPIFSVEVATFDILMASQGGLS